MVAITDKEKRQQILDALESGGLTVNQIAAAVGFNARSLLKNMEIDGALRFGEKVICPISGRSVKLVVISQVPADFNSVLRNMVGAR